MPERRNSDLKWSAPLSVRGERDEPGTRVLPEMIAGSGRDEDA